MQRLPYCNCICLQIKTSDGPLWQEAKPSWNEYIWTCHSTKLKDRILAYFPDMEMEAHKQGRDVVLIYNKDIGSPLRKACEHDADDDAIHLAKAAKIVRRDMIKLKNKFYSRMAWTTWTT